MLSEKGCTGTMTVLEGSLIPIDYYTGETFS